MDVASEVHERLPGRCDPAFFGGGVESVRRVDDPDGTGEWVIVRYVNGGQVSIYTTAPLMFVEPERH